MGEVVALPQRTSTTLPDVRGGHRALQVTWHEREDVLVTSLWRDGRCTGTVRLDPAEAAELVAVLTRALAGRHENDVASAG